jgi:hypothetical protein
MNPSQLIDQEIARLTDWRGELLAHLRNLINESCPDLHEDWKWNTPVWTGRKPICAIGAFKDHIRINFFKGASLTDPQHFFNAGLEAKTSRGIDIREGENINKEALKELLAKAVSLDA